MSNARTLSKIVVGTEIKIASVDSDLSNKIVSIKSRLDSDDSKIQSLDTALASVSASSGMADSDLKVVGDLRNQLDSEMLFVRNLSLSYTSFLYNATAGQTSFSGSDANSLTLAYTAGSIQVFLNGVFLTAEDYTATDGTTIVLTEPAQVSAQLIIVCPKLESNYIAPPTGPVWTGITPIQQLNLPSGNGTINYSLFFGQKQAISGDGNVIVVGTGQYRGPTQAHYATGNVWVFKANAGKTSWSVSGSQNTGISHGEDAVHRGFGGGGLATDGTGTYIAVGSTGFTIGSDSGVGKVWIYKKTGSDTYTLSQGLEGHGGNTGAGGEAFGRGCKLTSDGSMLFVGATNKQWVAGNSTTDAGALYVYTRSGETWSQSQLIEQSSSDRLNDDMFGEDIEITTDKSYMIVGCPTNASNAGKAYIYTYGGGTWTKQAKLVPSDGVALDQNGISVAISDDGATAVVGAWDADTGTTSRTGAAYVYTRSGTTWTQAQKFVPPGTGMYGRFGYSVDISSDANKIFIGHINFAGVTGQVHVYNLASGSYTLEESLNPDIGSAVNGLGENIEVDDNGGILVAGAINTVVSSQSNHGASFVFKAN